MHKTQPRAVAPWAAGRRSTLRSPTFLAASAVAAGLLTGGGVTSAAPLDPNAFASLGTLNPAAGTYAVTTGGTPTLTVGAATYTGVVRSQGAGLPEVAVFTFDNVNLASDVRINAGGPRPLAILSRAGLTLGGTINAAAGAAADGGPGAGGMGSLSGGGGGGFGGLGGNSGGFFDFGSGTVGGRGGTPYGDLASALQGGSAGGSDFNATGGTGGGALELGSVGTITLAATARLQARGGDGVQTGDFMSGAGGGSGGGLLLNASSVSVAGGARLVAAGGAGTSQDVGAPAGGGGGGGGRIAFTVGTYVAGDPAAFAPAGVLDVSGGAGGNNGGGEGQAGVTRLAARETVVPAGVVFDLRPGGFTEFTTTDLTVDAGGIAARSGAYANPGIVAVAGTFAATGTVSGGTFQLDGGTLVAPQVVTTGATLQGRGTVTGRVAGSGTVRATAGTLTVGDANRADAIDLDGPISVGQTFFVEPAALVLLDADRAVIGDATLGFDARLSAPNGTTLRPGRTLDARGGSRVGGAFTNNGTVNGPDALGALVRGPLVFTDDVDGAGSYTGNVRFSDGFSPGNSPAAVSLQNLAFDATATLTIEFGGTTPGTEFDQLLISGDAALGGATLDVELLNGFAPAAGNAFEILDIAGARTGAFAGLAEGSLVGNYGGTNLFITYAGGDGNDVVLFTTPVPEPAAVSLVGLAGLAGLALRRRRPR